MARSSEKHRRYWQRHKSSPTFRLAKSLIRTKSYAKRVGIPFSITATDLLPVPKRCPVLRIPLRYGTRRDRCNTPSIDRIVPKRGYVPGNVMIISYRANRIKNNATPRELQLVAKFYSR
jgi:hypothetical protein